MRFEQPYWISTPPPLCPSLIWVSSGAASDQITCVIFVIFSDVRWPQPRSEHCLPWGQRWRSDDQVSQCHTYYYKAVIMSSEIPSHSAGHSWALCQQVRVIMILTLALASIMERIILDWSHTEEMIFYHSLDNMNFKAHELL